MNVNVVPIKNYYCTWMKAKKNFLRFMLSHFYLKSRKQARVKLLHVPSDVKISLTIISKRFETFQLMLYPPWRKYIESSIS